jgi:phenol 2-monooxygenase
MITGEASHQGLAAGFPIGKRFKSAEVIRVCDGNVVHLGHHARADGRWRIYAFADAAPGEASALATWAQWMQDAPGSPIARFTPQAGDVDAVFDVKAIYQQPYDEVEFAKVPPLFRPQTGPLGLIDWEKVYAAGPGEDIFDSRELSRDGVVVVVRPDQYVAHVLPLTAVDELAAFFEGVMLPQSSVVPQTVLTR